MNLKSFFQVFGFLCFIFGFVAIFLQITGVRLNFLVWVESWGAGFGFLLKIMIVIIGFLCFYFARFDWQKEIEENS